MLQVPLLKCLSPKQVKYVLAKVHEGSCGHHPFGGGVGGGVKVSPVCFLVVKDGNVRMLSVPAPANSTTERIVEMLPDTLDKITAYLDSRKEAK